ncbi:MAG: hypothetical protein JNK05_09275 [Myxococcales bacterium]|nr:hypothetical protein [Myxococcales bacterium]
MNERSTPRHVAFDCAECGFEASYGGLCPNCNFPLHDRRHAERWQLVARSTEDDRSRDPWLLLVLGTLLPFVAMFFVQSALLGLMFISFLFALIANAWPNGYERRRRALFRRHRETPAKRLADVHDGEHVSLSAMPTIVTKALAPDGVEAIAYEQRYVTVEEREPSTLAGLASSQSIKRRRLCRSGGEFVCSIDGVEVRVKLEHFVILGAMTDDVRAVLSQTPVRVSGAARWTRDESAMNPRSSGRSLELTGTPESPIVIEALPLAQWLDDPHNQRAPSDVRVAIDAPSPAALTPPDDVAQPIRLRKTV